MGFVQTTPVKVASVLKLSAEMGLPVSARPIVLGPCVNMVSAVLMTLKKKRKLKMGSEAKSDHTKFGIIFFVFL